MTDKRNDMKRPNTPIAGELYDRLFLIADPETKWVRHYPFSGETCLAVNNTDPYKLICLSENTVSYLRDYFPDECVSLGNWNDDKNRTREHVVTFLSAALDDAIEEGA